MRQIVFLAVLVVPLVAREARAQVCSQPSPGVAQVNTNGVAVTINFGNSTIPKVNGASCGFSATAVRVIGVPGKDTVTLNYVPPTVPVTMALDAGTNTVTIYTTNGDDTVECGATSVDRNGDSTTDVDFGMTVLTALTLNTRAGNDVVDCTAAGYKTKLNGGTGADTLDGGPFNDTIDGGDGDDVIDGHAGNDALNGNLGNDAVYGDAGNDTFTTKTTFDGNDTYTGGAGTDNVSYAGRTTSVIAGGAGAEDSISDDVETIKGGKSADTLDFSTATFGHNLYGGPGDDTLRGGAGADKLYGEAGNDSLVGGGAKDTVIDAGDGDDSIGPMADGFVETVRCGPGTDAYVTNVEDIFKDCEGVPIDLTAPRHIASGEVHTCAILSGGSVKCWGGNAYGMLGLGDTQTRGDGPNEMGTHLPATQLGTGRTALSLGGGAYFTCAVLDDGHVKCWGVNDSGQLGLGDTSNRGDEPGEMGNALPAVDLGTGHTAKMVVGGSYHACAILDDNHVKCWGMNHMGQLGLGDTLARGDGPGEMGDALPVVDLGTGRTAKWIAAGSYHTCAVLDDNTLKCWGWNQDDQLGLPGSGDLGDEPGEMGDALRTVNVGGSPVVAVDAEWSHTCAVIQDGTSRKVKCWGDNSDGVLCLGDTNDRDDPRFLPYILTTTSLSLGGDTGCGLLSGGLSCWGRNYDGQLGQGGTANVGDDPGESPVPVSLGTGHGVVEVSVGRDFVCAKLDDATVKCWGSGGILGLGDSANRGDNPGEMGDSLPTVDLAGPVAFAPPSGGDDEGADTTEADGVGCAASRGDASLLVALVAIGWLARRRSVRRGRCRDRTCDLDRVKIPLCR